MEKTKAYLALTLSTLLFGFSFFAGKTALNAVDNDIFSLLSYRFVVAFIILSLVVMIRKDKISFKGKSIKNILLLSLFSPVLAFFFDALGLSMISSFEAGMFVALIPVASIGLNFLFFKERVSVLRIIFMTISIIGVFIINIFGFVPGASSGLGRIFMLLMVISASLYLIYSNLTSDEYSPIEITWTMMGLGAVTFTSIALVQNSLNGTLKAYIGVLANPSFLISILYLAVGCSIIAYLCLNYAIPKLNVSVVAIFANLTPVIAIFAGVMFLKEAIYWYHIIGSIVIIGGVLGASLISKNRDSSVKAID